jgi:hypothetical protein
MSTRARPKQDLEAFVCSEATSLQKADAKSQIRLQSAGFVEAARAANLSMSYAFLSLTSGSSPPDLSPKRNVDQLRYRLATSITISPSKPMATPTSSQVWPQSGGTFSRIHPLKED